MIHIFKNMLLKIHLASIRHQCYNEKKGGMIMQQYDILIVGASTTGSWFAKKMAEQGFRVLVIEKEEQNDVNRAYDIIHFGKADMERFGMEIPAPTDRDWGFTFASSCTYSPYGNHPKIGNPSPVVGVHKHDYIMRMNAQATAVGAEILYGAAFEDFIFDENKRIIGAVYTDKNGSHEVFARLVADCSGIPSAARTKLPDTATVENFPLTNKDIFFVVLYYVEYEDKSFKPRSMDGFCMQYKSWSAPSGNEHGAILGIGAGFGYDYAEEIFKDYIKNIKRPAYRVEKVEKGMTPYHRTLYSMVDDGFIAMGDAAFLTKPTCGEGVTSSMVQGEIAVDVISALLKKDGYLTKEALWPVNCRYVKAQGKDFDGLRPLLYGIISADYDEAEYLFANDCIFSNKILGGMGEDLALSAGDIAKMLAVIAKGVATKKLRTEVVGKIVKGLLQSGKVGKLYDNYPTTPDGFARWKEQADALWAEIGGMADTCDPKILKKLGYTK